MPTGHAHTSIPAIAEHYVATRGGWWLSVCDDAQPAGSRFLGVWITAEVDLRAASAAAWRAAGGGPQVTISAVPYPHADLDQVLPADRDRLLSKQDLARFGENTRNLDEVWDDQ